jgi:hypothetical protein
VPKLTHTPSEDDESILSQNAQKPLSFLGRQPGTRAELRDSLSCVRAALHGFSASSAETVREDDVLLDALFQGGFGDQKVLGVSDQKVHTQLRTVYSLVLARLESLKIDIDNIKIVAMVCCGGAPFYHFGMGDNIEKSVERQVELAVRFGFIFDLIPSTFEDYDSSLLDLSVAIGAVLLQKLKNNENGRGRSDGILFCCKGTMSAALASKAYSELAPQKNPKHVALVGMGTDLSQGFIGCAPEMLSSAGFSISAINSLQDTNVGNGKKILDDFMTSCTSVGCKNKTVWLDINENVQMFGGRQPEHSWYYEAFWRRSADSLRVAILNFLSDACDATPVNSAHTTEKDSRVSQKVREQLESREKNIKFDFNEITHYKSNLRLNPVKPRVKHMAEWIEGNMFVKQ